MTVPQGTSAIATVLQAFEAGLTLWREPPLVAGQDTENRGLGWVCSHCFKFLGSIEMQIAWRLICQQAGGEPACTVPAPTLPMLLCPRLKGLLLCAAHEALSSCTLICRPGGCHTSDAGKSAAPHPQLAPHRSLLAASACEHLPQELCCRQRLCPKVLQTSIGAAKLCAP